MPDSGIHDVTEPIEMEIVDDRLRFTVVSGQSRRIYAVSFHKARGAIMAAEYLLNKQAGKAGCQVLPFGKKG